MKCITRSILIAITLAATAVADEPKPNTLSEAELAEGWLLLFDGESLFGWKPSSEVDWRVVGGTLVAAVGEPGLLYTTSQFGNYELKVDFRVAEGGNSGVFLHTIPSPTRADLTTKCYEVNISGEAKAEWPTGSIVDRQTPQANFPQSDEDRVIHKRETFMEEQYPATVPAANPQWQTLAISVKDGRVIVKLGDQTTADYTDPKPLRRGPVGLQFRTGRIEFRNVKLRPLGMTSIFNGNDLTGWKPFPGMASEFSVTPEGWLHVVNGKGQLETAGRYADFTLQLEAFVAVPGINSGVFFRSIPGELMNGYESQIQNGYKDGDRTKPADCGTGGIFRRQNARKVVADDLAWFTKTIHADGPHVAVWVNGYQVSDWTDARKPDANPRKGLRLEPGTIILQAHDSTTDLKFRNLRIAELPVR